MTVMPLWDGMNASVRHAADQLSRSSVPTVPGVYAWYRNGEPVYSGRATGKTGLQGRIWGNHLQTGNDLSRSSFRRNVCEFLEIAPTSETKARPTRITVVQVEPANQWIRGCDVSWIECSSSDEAKELEKALHREWMPPLSRR